ncbi:MAG: N-acetyl-gamma-glutamyl-phosphate reductase [Dehalococcoidales bacterium]|nr:N-acetyl-gamma-glutamyl-phosphate reductase [Dehalococcoidales bacterium]
MSKKDDGKMKTVFIDGQHGTVGLQIHERLGRRKDIELVEIPEEKRKDPETKKKLLNEVDIVFLCLPDDAARESVSLIHNKSVCLIDGSTAHRVSEDWVYGLPELRKEQRNLIANSKRITVPGCHATGFVLLLYPLVAKGIVAPDYPVTSQAVAGYSGGGRGMIADYETEGTPDYIKNPRGYSLDLNHKHLPEMMKITGLSRPPLFSPTVVDEYNGEIVYIPLPTAFLKKQLSASDIREVLAEYYAGERFVKVISYPADDHLKNGFLTFTDCNDTNNLEIFVFGGQDRILLAARFDNLGKGSSGAAVQNMNLILGIPETTALEDPAVSR